MIKHLLLKGNNITIPLCGSTEIGKVAVFNRKISTCEVCNEIRTQLDSVDSYENAIELIPFSAENLKEHNTTEENFNVSVLGTKEIFWKNILG